MQYSIRDLMDSLVAAPTQEECLKIMNEYRQRCEHADVNVGYCAGYYGAETYKRLHQWLGLRHPVFGNVYPDVAQLVRIGALQMEPDDGIPEQQPVELQKRTKGSRAKSSRDSHANT